MPLFVVQFLLGMFANLFVTFSTSTDPNPLAVVFTGGSPALMLHVVLAVVLFIFRAVGANIRLVHQAQTRDCDRNRRLRLYRPSLLLRHRLRLHRLQKQHSIILDGSRLSLRPDNLRLFGGSRRTSVQPGEIERKQKPDRTLRDLGHLDSHCYS